MRDVTDDSFETDVIERSLAVPVVVDLWAPWCGPCRTLGPILEKVIGATEGRVELAKVDIDQNPRVSATFKVQSIPAVFALKDKRVADSFIGAQGEPFVQAFVDRLAPPASEADLLAEAGDEASLRRALDIEPGHPGAVVALAELLVGQGQTEEALALLARVPETADVRRVAALARTGPAPASDEVDAKLEALLPKVKGDDDARQAFVDLLEVLGPDDPRTAAWRRRLTTALF
ncbi:MAG TPA: tetratricopeptide repeat protein [Acidimicrobiales bacterium]|nr:tetratricopeptide repeat protein [Acidimicrobiales bacterium]